jgi:hypothetical protein
MWQPRKLASTHRLFGREGADAFHIVGLRYALGYLVQCVVPYRFRGAVQSRDLASAMRTALTTRGLADCACLILKTVSMVFVCRLEC